MSLPQPNHMILLNSKKGKEMFLQTENSSKPYTSGYFKISQNFETQITPSYCGVASMVMVLNSISTNLNSRPKSSISATYHAFDQKNFFNEEAEKLHGAAGVSRRGMQFKEFEGLMRCHEKGISVEAHLGMDLSLSEFRETLKRGLLPKDDKESFVIIYYDRSIVGQEGAAHISPIGGYNEENDMFLLLDVARFKYEVAWIATDMLYKSMNYKSKITNFMGYDGGFLIVSSDESSSEKKKLEFKPLKIERMLLMILFALIAFFLTIGILIGKYIL
jgi:hypothetical protein